MKRFALLVTALVAGIVLVACGDDTTAPGAAEPASTDHNTADVSFAQNMIPHHRQAIQMADLAATHASDPQVAELATRIRAAQDPEITTMTGWLRTWGEPTGTTGPGAMGHGSAPGHGSMGHGSTGADSASAGTGMGMMSEADMAGLTGMRGAEFDRMFLEMMIGHHEGAVSMAETEIREGVYGPAKAMAQNIQTNQAAEIQAMNTMLHRN
ncbi:DUF305 domain-containing protein [Protofrankia symbiont of Coriaria ruscifolia]|uniref:DUF305 domain-containing protein n=1 Tax=Protofrankia symbiont of Coriaria ruscifolia TaxID=1306542 RepID=UPI0010416C1C|nr:DUF305 domain-containing protein [Protofrankia symbiont of Coriaria ruscifolia]